MEFKNQLFEDAGDLHLYQDDETGNIYYFDGEKLVLYGKKPEIGDKGNQDIQDQEEREREAQAKADDEEEGKEGESEEARLKRIEKIKQDLDSDEMAQKISSESDDAVRREQRKKAERNTAQYNASPLQSFKLSLEGFIKNQIAMVKGTSWSKINKTYAHSNIMKPGRTRMTQGKIPLINVYFDQSGSWGPDDIKIGEQAISTLNKYVRQGDIQIKLFYFANDVTGTRGDRSIGSGTNLDPVIKHINATKPDNVIIMTDSDGDWTTYSSSAKVPGAVWFLWRNAYSRELQKHLSGKEMTKSFMLT